MPGFLCRPETRLLSLPLTPNQDCSGIDLMGEILRGRSRSQASGRRLRVEATLAKTISSASQSIRLLALQAGGGANLKDLSFSRRFTPPAVGQTIIDNRQCSRSTGCNSCPLLHPLNTQPELVGMRDSPEQEPSVDGS